MFTYRRAFGYNVLCSCSCTTINEDCTYPLASCINGNMRLVSPDGPNMVEGRVEYCSNGLWGTVTYYGFDNRDGEVVCRRLGYHHPSKTFCTC